jgi:hypothetical protein
MNGGFLAESRLTSAANPGNDALKLTLIEEGAEIGVNTRDAVNLSVRIASLFLATSGVTTDPR